MWLGSDQVGLLEESNESGASAALTEWDLTKLTAWYTVLVVNDRDGLENFAATRC